MIKKLTKKQKFPNNCNIRDCISYNFIINNKKFNYWSNCWNLW